MTHDVDIERTLAHWLVEGADEMPDRVYRTILDRVERQPQAVAPRLLRRLPAMNGPFRIALAAAAVIVIAIVALEALPGSRGVGVPAATPTSVPTGSPISSTTPGALPTGAAQRSYSWPGPLAAGTYTTTLIWSLPFEVTFTIPDGWEGYDIEISKPGSHGLSVEFVLVENVFRDPCGGTVEEPPIGSSVDALANALMTLPGLGATSPTSIDFDRSTRGSYVEYSLPENAGCSPAVFQLWDLPAENFLPGKPTGGDSKAVAYRDGSIWILDVDGVRFILRTTWDAGVTQAERAELQSIVDSIEFSGPGETPGPEPAAP